MAKFSFPFSDQPKRFPFLSRDTISFPFIVEGIAYYWTIRGKNVDLYISADKIRPGVLMQKEITMPGITFYLGATAATALELKDYITFKQYGAGLDTLGALDPYNFGRIDALTLGAIVTNAADWMAMQTSMANAMQRILASADTQGMTLDSTIHVKTDTVVFTGTIREAMGIIGIRSERDATIGDIDPKIFEDIDMMMNAFKVYGNVPAHLVKGIAATETNIGMSLDKLPLNVVVVDEESE